MVSVIVILNSAISLHLEVSTIHLQFFIAVLFFKKDGKIARILDFDVSKFKTEGTKYSALKMDNMKMWTYTGTLYFLAPEFFEDMEYT